MTATGYFALALFPFVFVAFWLGICWLISLSGWRQLSRHFQASEAGSQAPATSFWMQSGTLRKVGAIGFGANYRGALTIRCGSAGLELAVLFLFRFGHPPLLVPWSALGQIEEKLFFGLIRSYIIPIDLPDGSDGVELRLTNQRLVETVVSYQQAARLGK
ncbi:hypothetical protein [Hymenobacter sp.]|jgi:hypothetical protein|uniref:hypothetical protein n=1 Tax=Hymenobacter sp. TaxID=1898978 RepID=UPI002EDB4D38